MQNVPIRAAGEAVPAAIVNLTLPRSGIVLTIAQLADGRTVMLGRSGRAL
jgi:hypothetical protein